MPAIIVFPSVRMPALVKFHHIKSSPFDFQGTEIIPRLHTPVPIIVMFIKVWNFQVCVSKYSVASYALWSLYSIFFCHASETISSIGLISLDTCVSWTCFFKIKCTDIQWREWLGTEGQIASPGKLNANIRPPLSLYFGFAIILVFSRKLFFRFYSIFRGFRVLVCPSISGFNIITQVFFLSIG